MGFFSNLGHKVSGFVDKGISIGKKVSHARSIGEGIDKAEAISGAVRSGIERVKTITGGGSFGSKVDAVKGLAGDVRAIKANLPSRKRRP